MLRLNGTMSGQDIDDLVARLPEIFDTVADGVTVLDRNGVVRFANDAAAKLLGRTAAAEIIGSSGAELTADFELLDQDGGPFDRARMPTGRAFAGEEAEEIMRFRRRGTGVDRWSLVRARLLPGATHDADLVVTAFQDITSLKRSEARLRLLAEASAALGRSVEYRETLARVAEVVVPALAEGCAVDVLEWPRNVSRVAALHVDPAKQAIAREIQRRWPPHPDLRGAVNQMLRRRRSLLVDATDGVLSHVAREPAHLEMLRRLEIGALLVVPLEARGELLGALTLVRSPSQPAWQPEDVALVEELGRRAGVAIDAARLLREARETARLRDDFIAVASHDMRTPLAAIRGYAQLARRHVQRSSHEQKERLDRWLGEIDSVVGQMNELVSELMDVSLLSGGDRVPLQPAETSLATLVDELLDRRRSLAPRHRFEVERDGEVPSGFWDRRRVSRVLDNLLDNAVKFSPEGGTVVVRLGAGDSRAWVAVSDEGIGIPREDHELIFSPMYRGRNAARLPGTGLGLSGSRRLIEQMGGAIAVSSEPGEGATFTLSLPLHR